MVHGLKPMGKPSTKNKSHKFWTEPRPCMVLGLKPMGKPTTGKEKLHCKDLRVYPRKTLHLQLGQFLTCEDPQVCFRICSPKGIDAI